MNKTKRDGFSFLNSYYQVYKRLGKAEKVIFMDTLLEIQFLESTIADAKFDNAMTDMGFHSIIHSLQSTIDGYLLQARKHDGFIGVHQGGTIGGTQEEKEKEKEKEEEEEKGEYTLGTKFNFSLKKKTSYDNLTEEYQEKLFGACMIIDGNLTRYEDFVTSLRAVGYQYKNFPLVYMSWDKEKAYKNFIPEDETKLGTHWKRIILGNGELLAVHEITFETKEGRIT